MIALPAEHTQIRTYTYACKWSQMAVDFFFCVNTHKIANAKYSGVRILDLFIRQEVYETNSKRYIAGCFLAFTLDVDLTT